MWIILWVLICLFFRATKPTQENAGAPASGNTLKLRDTLTYMLTEWICVCWSSALPGGLANEDNKRVWAYLPFLTYFYLLGHDTNAFMNAFILLLTSMEFAKSHTCTCQIPVGNECECICTRFPRVQVQVYSQVMLLNVRNITQTLIYSRLVQLIKSKTTTCTLDIPVGNKYECIRTRFPRVFPWVYLWAFTGNSHSCHALYLTVL